MLNWLKSSNNKNIVNWIIKKKFIEKKESKERRRWKGNENKFWQWYCWDRLNRDRILNQTIS